MRYFVILLFAVVLLTGVPVSAFAQEAAEGNINGQVFNGTEGGGSVAGVKITLITYIDDMVSETTTTVTDREGKFRFDDVVREHEYLVSAKYMDVDYYYPVVFKSGEGTAQVEVGVCDVTDKDNAIRIALAHTVIDITEDSLNIKAAYWLYNDGDMTYVGPDGALVFTLPEGDFGFKAPQELMIDYHLEDSRVAYLVPFPPGERQLFYTYRLPKPTTNEFTFPLKVDYLLR